MRQTSALLLRALHTRPGLFPLLPLSGKEKSFWFLVSGFQGLGPSALNPGPQTVWFQGLGFRLWGLGVLGLGSRGFRAWGCRVSGVGFEGFRLGRLGLLV